MCLIRVNHVYRRSPIYGTQVTPLSARVGILRNPFPLFLVIDEDSEGFVAEESALFWPNVHSLRARQLSGAGSASLMRPLDQFSIS